MNKKTNIVIIKKEQQNVTRKAKHNSYDSDDIAWNITIRGFEVSDEENRYDFIVDNPVKSHYYLVYAVYSTGDSFHHVTGKVSLVSLVNSFEDAEAISDAIENDYENNKDKHGNLEVKLSSGSTEKIYVSWKGYFESLESVQIETIRRVKEIKFYG